MASQMQMQMQMPSWSDVLAAEGLVEFILVDVNGRHREDEIR